MNIFIKDWLKISLQSYTAWAFYVLALITVAPDVIYTVFEVDTNPVVWGRLQIITIIAGLVGRMVLQPERTRWRRRLIIGILVAAICSISFPALAQAETDNDQIAFELISKWEGKRNYSYQDIVGVWTICYGHTRTAGPGQYKTDEQCRELLIDEISEYRSGLRSYFAPDTIWWRLTPHRDAAYSSLAFNVGIRAAGRSTATRRLNRGNIAGGCEALTWWNRAGGRVVRGLVRRRSEEREYCLRGLS